MFVMCIIHCTTSFVREQNRGVHLRLSIYLIYKIVALHQNPTFLVAE